jgi:molybdopterin synthase catalytic subunit
VNSKIKVAVQTEDFDVSQETKRLSLTGTGGINTFLGIVRHQNDDSEVRCLRLEHYPGMTESQIGAIIEEAERRWEVLAATVIHRIGDLYPGDQIVFVGVASPHRGDAFDACEFIIDYLKTRATFWKKEILPDTERWLTTRQSDVDTAKAWKN